MPRDNSGIYSLPNGYLAVTGTTVLPSQHNPPLEDLAASMSSSLPRNGAAPMTGPLKATDGTVSAPAMAFASDVATGIYKTSNGFAVTVGGVKVAEFGAGGLILGGVPIGGGMDFWGDTAPAGWLFPYGQAVSRITYDALFAAIGTTYGTGDGSTTFNLPDKRGRASFAKDNMGGTAANRITTAGSGVNGTTLGAAGGAQTVTLVQGNLPAIKPAITITDPGHTHNIAFKQGVTGTGSAERLQPSPSDGAYISASNTTGITAAFTSNLGSGTAVNKLPPGIICNYIIFAGA